MAKAYILINCDTGSEGSVISHLDDIDTVKESHGTFGSYDIITKLESENEANIQQTLSKKIRKIQKIRSTLTLLAHREGLFGKKLAEEEKEVLGKYMAQAYVVMNCKKGEEENILGEMSKIPDIIEGDLLLGSYEIICKIVAPTYNDISDVVTKKLRKLKNIRSTITLNVIEK